MTEAFKELSIVKEHLVKLALCITSMQAGNAMHVEDATYIQDRLRAVREPITAIEETLQDLVFDRKEGPDA
jgi:hypothetical protein